eukprot:g16350.t1
MGLEMFQEVTWALKEQRQVASTAFAFAAILQNGQVVTWGEKHCGGDSSSVQHLLKEVQQVRGSRQAFAAIVAGGKVVTWGHPNAGGSCDYNVAQQLQKLGTLRDGRAQSDSSCAGKMVHPEVHPIHHGVQIEFVHMLDTLESDTTHGREGAKPFIIPIVGLVIGIFMMNLNRCMDMEHGQSVSTVGKLVLYFGAQSFMNIFMGWVFRTHVTLPQGYQLPNGETLMEDLHGCPVGFALTAMQQVISFLCFIVVFLGPKTRRRPRQPGPRFGQGLAMNSTWVSTSHGLSFPPPEVLHTLQD